MALTYSSHIPFQAGEVVSVDTGNGDGMTRKTRIPAMILTTASGAPPASGTAADPSNTQSAPLPAGADRSGTAATASGQLAAANVNRRGLDIQNIGANNIGVNEIGGAAAIGSPGTYTIAPGGSFRVRTNRQINVIAATAATAYSATEY